MTEPAAVAAPADLHSQVGELVRLAPQWPGQLTDAFTQTFIETGVNWPLSLLLMLGLGFAGEKLLCWRLNTLKRRLLGQQSDNWLVACGFALFRLFFDLVGVVLFAFIGWLSLHALVDEAMPVFATLDAIFVSFVAFRMLLIVFRTGLAPHNEGIRPIALDNDDALVFYRWIVVFVALYLATGIVNEHVLLARMDPLLDRASRMVFGFVLIGYLCLLVWCNRARVERLFASPRHTDTSPSMLKQMLLQTWPHAVSAWLVLVYANWAYAVFIADRSRRDALLVAWWITLLFPAIDRLVSGVLEKITLMPFLQESGFAQRRDRFLSTVQGCLRVILVVVAVTALAVTWNIAEPGVLKSSWARAVIWAAVDVGAVLLVAYVLYEVVMSMLDKHMPTPPESGSEAGVDMEAEIGGAGASREETLAPLLRLTFVVLLTIVVVLSVLSAVGVQIVPLLAGASIIGLAIGFGSQKLVADVISGVFFLIDDAFRRGEYIDVGAVKGTVEKISIRSMQLRHHMGALHSIPFGEIHHLTNFSRDWVVMKLKLRVPYDTDVDKVRKLIKKLGQSLQEDEELGSLFLQPLKSQGVYSMEDDSAMIIRVKFMTRPGDQFVVRKAVYQMIRELFEREGIEFAHRVVSVRLDQADVADLTERGKEKVAAAGASSVLRQESSPAG